MAVKVSVSSTISINYLWCEGEELGNAGDIDCKVDSQANNSATLIFTAKSSSKVLVVGLKVRLWTSSAAAASVVVGNNYYYTVEVHLPQTNSLNQSTPYGSSYLPHFTQPYSCTALFPLTAIPTPQTLQLSLPLLNSAGLQFPCDFTFTVDFTNSRTWLVPTSTLLLSFSGVTQMAESQCWLRQPMVPFAASSWTASTLTLSASEHISGFGLNIYRLNCTSFLLTSPTVTLSLKWLNNNSTILQQPTSPLTLPTLYTSPTPVALSLSSKSYNTLGYDAKVVLLIGVAHQPADRV